MSANNSSVYVGDALSSLLGRYVARRLEEHSSVYMRIYDRWIAETRLLTQLADSEIVDGDLAVWTTLDDFVGRVNSITRGTPVSAKTVRDDLRLIKLHLPLPHLKKYTFEKHNT